MPQTVSVLFLTFKSVVLGKNYYFFSVKIFLTSIFFLSKCQTFSEDMAFLSTFLHLPKNTLKFLATPKYPFSVKYLLNKER